MAVRAWNVKGDTIMYNKVIMMGRICTDVGLKTTPNGTNVCSFRIAVDRRFQQKGEERKTDFFNVVAWRSTGGACQ